MRKFNVVVNGKQYSVEVEEDGSESVSAVSVAAPVAADKPAAKPAVAGGTAVNSPLPGLILSLAQSEGAKVKKGDKLIVLEAMKMENDVFSPADGTVSYAVKKGDNVETGAVLAYIK